MGNSFDTFFWVTFLCTQKVCSYGLSRFSSVMWAEFYWIYAVVALFPFYRICYIYLLYLPNFVELKGLEFLRYACNMNNVRVLGNVEFLNTCYTTFTKLSELSGFFFSFWLSQLSVLWHKLGYFFLLFIFSKQSFNTNKFLYFLWKAFSGALHNWPIFMRYLAKWAFMR